MAPAPNPEALAACARYIENKKILIVDSSIGVRTTVLRIFKDLGARATNLIITPDWEHAIQVLEKTKPQIVVCDYNLGAHCGVELLKLRRESLSDYEECLSVIITRNARESAIAEAAEEDVDCYILKPFTIATFTKYIVNTILRKASPSPYQLSILEGKGLLTALKPTEAYDVFRKAIFLDPTPALAHYYLAKTCIALQELDEAEENFRQGLRLSSHHYRCMTGLFELYVSKQLDAEAYEIATKICEYFPVTPEKLDLIVRLAAKCGKFSDIPGYYELYLAMDFRTPQLTKCIIAGLFVAGMASLDSGRESHQAIEFFKKAAVSSGRSATLYIEIITALIKRDYFREAELFLKEFPQEQKTGPDYIALDYMILDRTGEPPAIIEHGRKLVEKGIRHPTIYEILIRRSAESGYLDYAEKIATDGAKLWPDLVDSFMALSK